MVLGEIRIRRNRAEQRESSTLGDEPCVVVGYTNNDQARRTGNIPDESERTKHGLELRSPCARDDAQTVDAREQTMIEATGTGAQIEDNG
ncbi:MAG TPA: hypothetical protein VI056_04075 [Candidatus Limnocylindria bacterium]